MLAGLAACTPARSSSPARVYFVEPQDQATVSSPLQVRLGADNFAVEPAGEVREGVGHLHILVDTACIAPGQGIPKDDQHLHYGKGQLEAELDLSPGEHTLCLQAANGSHIALEGAGMTQSIQVTVVERVAGSKLGIQPDGR
jgi:hypothetical protein